jgi:hypothetical protein
MQVQEKVARCLHEVNVTLKVLLKQVIYSLMRSQSYWVALPGNQVNQSWLYAGRYPLTRMDLDSS